MTIQSTARYMKGSPIHFILNYVSTMHRKMHQKNNIWIATEKFVFHLFEIKQRFGDIDIKKVRLKN